MATTPTQIRIDTIVKEQANDLFSNLGIDMSSAVNIFLRQCILHGGLPFPVELPRRDQSASSNPYAYSPAADDDANAISDQLMETNDVAYRELAK